MANLTEQGREKLKDLEEDIADDVQRYWRGNLLDSQQSLAQDIKVFVQDEGTQVGSRNEILKFLEWGTRPHVITPDEAQALRWFNDNGEAVFATKVFHPGTKPYGHLRSALDRKRVELR